MRSRVFGAGILMALALLFSISLERGCRAAPPSTPASSVRATTYGDAMVTHVPDDRILRVELDRMPQDYLVCLGAVCKLPAEWREVK